MREKSIRWMIGTLIVFALIFLGLYLLIPKKTKVSAQNIATSPVLSESSPIPSGQLPQITPEPLLEEPAENQAEATDAPAEEDLARQKVLTDYISNMPMRDKLGQLVMFGFTGTSSVNLDFRNIISKYHIGNIVLYGDNINDNLEDGGFERANYLTRKLQRYNQTEIPYLISIDIEGGSVRRFDWDDTLSSARSLGKRNNYEEAYNQFYMVGKKLKETGINMNLAPVLDISENARKTFLDTRIISGDPDVASNIGCAVIAGLNDALCLSTAKHFPGHGGTTDDSHNATPVISKTKEDMESYDLIPFATAIKAGVDTVLVAHISYPKLDPDDIASMSSIIITDILRNELGHTGIVMSDDFRMGGLKTRYNVGDAAVRFLLAGGDLILCGPRHDLQTQIMDGLNKGVEDGLLTEERINESVYRILEKKMKVTSWSPNQAQTD